MSNNPDDFAVVIGISRYPHLADRADSVNDAKAFASWLQDGLGGGLPPENVVLVVSDEVKDQEEARPTREDVQRAFEPLVNRGIREGSRLGRRLYIYAAGRGYGPNSEKLGLLMADADQQSLGSSSIPVKAYADYFQAAGLYEEVVLFVDSDRLAGQGEMMAPPWVSVKKSSSSATYFYAFRGKSKDGPDSVSSPSSESLSQSRFTQALLEGLRGAAAPSDGRVTSDSLRDYVSDRLRVFSVTEQQPEFIFGGGRPIVFGNIKKAEDSESERVSTQPDDPATVDELGRRPFAEVVAARIEEVWNSQGAASSSKVAASSSSAFSLRISAASVMARARSSLRRIFGNADGPPVGSFMVHIHGPWGSGKTSVLNFLREHLQDNSRPLAKRWVVIEFNAWRNQRIRPPWWTLIKEIYTQSARQLGLRQSILLRLRWLLWRARADWLPLLLAGVLILAAILVTTGVIDFLPDHEPTSNNPSVSSSGDDQFGKAVELGLKILTAIFATGAAIVALSRSLVFGSPRAAKMYSELRSDPLGPIVRLFQKLVKGIHRPVVVFIDDLDRCESKYVIELLEGTQTVFRKAPVTYVVAADRKWISSSFEQGFASFGRTIGEPGRPLGYLFLDKVFQVSASIPQPSPKVRREYWKRLLRQAASDDPKVLDEARKLAEREALEVVKNAHTQEELDVKIAEVSHDPLQEQAMRAAAAKQITSPEAQRKTEHRLRRFSDLLEANPRSMKRLVNTYGFHQATHFLEGRNVAPEALARWTIIELRWPLLADFLSVRPHFIANLASGNAPNDASVPNDLIRLFGDEDVMRVVLGDLNGSKTALDEATLREIVGLVGEASFTKDNTRRLTSHYWYASA